MERTVDAYGCSNSQLDTDEDGVTDDVDICSDTPNGESSRCLVAVQTHNKILMEME